MKVFVELLASLRRLESEGFAPGEIEEIAAK
jgi:hypothetical protein